jgi:hypothetical protein
MFYFTEATEQSNSWRTKRPVSRRCKPKKTAAGKKRLPHGKSLADYSDGEYIAMGDRMSAYDNSISETLQTLSTPRISTALITMPSPKKHTEALPIPVAPSQSPQTITLETVTLEEICMQEEIAILEDVLESNERAGEKDASEAVNINTEQEAAVASILLDDKEIDMLCEDIAMETSSHAKHDTARLDAYIASLKAENERMTAQLKRFARKHSPEKNDDSDEHRHKKHRKSTKSSNSRANSGNSSRASSSQTHSSRPSRASSKGSHSSRASSKGSHSSRASSKGSHSSRASSKGSHSSRSSSRHSSSASCALKAQLDRSSCRLLPCPLTPPPASSAGRRLSLSYDSEVNAKRRLFAEHVND